MEIDFANQQLSIGIRDFVSFGQSSYPMTTMGSGGTWRTQLGQHWHNQLWQEAQQLYGEAATAEITISGEVEFEGWRFELSGRIDQLLKEENQLVLREIKTTQQVIPLPRDELEQIFPDYFEQVACYQFLASQNEEWRDERILSELLMLHVDTGIRQSIIIDEDPIKQLEHRLKVWVDFLNGQKKRDDRVRHLIVPAAFEHFREDQIPVRELLLREINPETPSENQFIALQAATGFGKTSIAIEWALKGLQQGNFKRVIYVTGKNTGQVQVVEELKRFKEMAAGIRFFQIRNMDTHLDACPHLQCPCRHRSMDGPKLESFIPFRATQDLLSNGSPSIQEIGLHASNYQLCPRLVSQSCLSHTEFWIADYNYVFSGGAQGIVGNITGFDPATTLLVVDETHNLHERVASNFSASINSFTLDQLLSYLRDFKAPRKLQACTEQILRFTRSLDEQDSLPLTEEYQLFDLLEEFQKTLLECGAFLLKLPEQAVELLWELGEAYHISQKKELHYLNWVPKQGTIRLNCIDASPAIRETVASYAKTLFMSATFPPRSEFENQIGLKKEEIVSINAESLWRNEAYSVAIDCRLNTTYKKRYQFYNLTSDTIASCTKYSQQPILVFFPSYQYADIIAEYLQVSNPHLRVLTLEKGMKPDEQIESIQFSALSYDILCLPLGSGLSEGIDILGGLIDTVVVVSPSLPEVNAIQNAKSERYSSKAAAFRANYLVPGMTKVNQALGRIVRKPEHRAKVLLHCERFAQRDYQNLLSQEYQHSEIIKNGYQLEDWLSASFED